VRENLLMMLRRFTSVALLAVAGASFVALFAGQTAPPVAAAAQATAAAVYYPPPGAWPKRSASDLGLDQAALDAAVQFAQTRESTRAMDFSDQERIFGSMLGSVPNIRAKTNGLVIYKGYVVAEFGDTTWADPTYSVAKSMMATVAGLAVRDGKIASLDEPVGRTVKDGGYDSPRNALVTWKMHLQQETEWEGTMFSKKDDFVGKEQFGEGERKPRELRRPGSFYEYNDVRINRLGLSLLRTFKDSVPDVFRREVMDVIGASNTWRWIPYHNSFVDVDGKRVASVSGGTRWGGGVWINAQDMARFGYLWLRGGKWGDKQILPPEYVKAALAPSQHGPDYGYLWWLNTQGKNYPGLPTNAYGARGAGSNTITILPDQDLVVVWRWHAGNEAEFVKRVVAAIRPTSSAR
jgi:CubicO group peptidase (beta-lactamase class C family)